MNVFETVKYALAVLNYSNQSKMTIDRWGKPSFGAACGTYWEWVPSWDFLNSTEGVVISAGLLWNDIDYMRLLKTDRIAFLSDGRTCLVIRKKVQKVVDCPHCGKVTVDDTPPVVMKQ
jgi:hypothetical protein